MTSEPWEELRALCNTKWGYDVNSDELHGTWAEDDSRYLIKVPTQLRPILMSLQHAVCDIIAARDQHALLTKMQETTLRLLYPRSVTHE